MYAHCVTFSSSYRILSPSPTSSWRLSAAGADHAVPDDHRGRHDVLRPGGERRSGRAARPPRWRAFLAAASSSSSTAAAAAATAAATAATAAATAAAARVGGGDVDDGCCGDDDGSSSSGGGHDSLRTLVVGRARGAAERRGWSGLRHARLTVLSDAVCRCVVMCCACASSCLSCFAPLGTPRSADSVALECADRPADGAKPRA